ncbi:MAG: hypothetical protein H6728_11960 [Myxococcales bacterium]|nr:hypothetical protein [Myxococcales bacterium]
MFSFLQARLFRTLGLLVFLQSSLWGVSCIPRQKRVCLTDKNCAGTIEPTVCYEKECLPRVCEVGATRSCYTGTDATKERGECKSGLQVCTKNGSDWSTCLAEVVPVEETCDGQDNDCDGKSDEGLNCVCEPGSQRPCFSGPKDASTTQPSFCAQGVQICTGQKVWGRCLGQRLPSMRWRQALAAQDTQQVQTSFDTCLEPDADCDGQLDLTPCTCEQGTTRPCYLGPLGTEGKGICKAGTQTCVARADGSMGWGFCVGQVLPKAEEELGCNGKDDDCDGLIDNQTGTQVPLWQRCQETTSSGCTKIQVCQNQEWGPCLHREICGNQVDDNCDSQIDESGTEGCCQAQERCGNQVDDDCDGAVDEKNCETP